MSDMNRREAVQTLAVATALAWTPREIERARRLTDFEEQQGQGHPAFKPKFFNAHEYATVTMLADMIIPRDQHSGSASDAGVPPFMDFMMTDGPNPDRQTAMQGGLAWLDEECVTRFGKRFILCTEANRKTVLDDIAWPAKARPEMTAGVQFFNRFRDLTASGFYSSRMGVQDLKYLGNQVVHEWKGCPEEQLRKLGVSY
ncbi:MAG TPA: gluconate 2-dehydrogenase subunit 3 family protein [Gemmatimonadales bacterium]|jgi:hypothetical protein